jgi:hypothetical protein
VGNARALVEVRANRSGRRVVHHRRAVAARHQQAALERNRRHGDDTVAAHGAVALVVHEEDAGVRPGHHRLGEDGAVHVRMAARLEHQGAPQMIGMPLHPLALVEHRLAVRRRKSVDDEAKRFTGRVRVDGSQLKHPD